MNSSRVDEYRKLAEEQTKEEERQATAIREEKISLQKLQNQFHNTYGITAEDLKRQLDILKIDLNKPIPSEYAIKELDKEEWKKKQYEAYDSAVKQYEIDSNQGQYTQTVKPEEGNFVGDDIYKRDKEYLENTQRKHQATINLLNNSESIISDLKNILEKQTERKQLSRGLKKYKEEKKASLINIKTDLNNECIQVIKNILQQSEFWKQQRSGASDYLSETTGFSMFTYFKFDEPPTCIKDYSTCINNYSKNPPKNFQEQFVFLDKLINIEIDRKKRDKSTQETQNFSENIYKLAHAIKSDNYGAVCEILETLKQFQNTTQNSISPKQPEPKTNTNSPKPF